MSSETDEENLDRELYIAKFSRIATSGEAVCCKCDNVAFVYPGDSVPMGRCIVCIREESDRRVERMESGRGGGACVKILN